MMDCFMCYSFNAAGQLIENVTKSVRRKQTVDEVYMEKLFAEVNSLYRLDQHTADPGAVSKADLGPLPSESVTLLAALAAAWLGIIAYVAAEAVKKKKSQKTAARN